MRENGSAPDLAATGRMAIPDPANLDLVRSIYQEWERGDYSSTAWADPDIEYVFADGPTPGRWNGLTEMGWVWREWLSAWEEFRVRAEQFRRLDDERVLVLVNFGGRGKASGLPLDETQAKSASLFHVRSGKVTRFVVYFDRERARDELGLEPEAGRRPS